MKTRLVCILGVILLCGWTISIEARPDRLADDHGTTLPLLRSNEWVEPQLEDIPEAGSNLDPYGQNKDNRRDEYGNRGKNRKYTRPSEPSEPTLGPSPDPGLVPLPDPGSPSYHNPIIKTYRQVDPQLEQLVIAYIAGLLGIDPSQVSVTDMVDVTPEGMDGSTKVLVSITIDDEHHYQFTASKGIYPDAQWAFDPPSFLTYYNPIIKVYRQVADPQLEQLAIAYIAELFGIDPSRLNVESMVDFNIEGMNGSANVLVTVSVKDGSPLTGLACYQFTASKAIYPDAQWAFNPTSFLAPAGGIYQGPTIVVRLYKPLSDPALSQGAISYLAAQINVDPQGIQIVNMINMTWQILHDDSSTFAYVTLKGPDGMLYQLYCRLPPVGYVQTWEFLPANFGDLDPGTFPEPQPLY